MSAVSVGSVASIFTLFWRNPDSNRLNHGSMRMVLLPKVISQPFVPNHLKLTPAAPGPPPRGAVSAPSAAPGTNRERPRLAVAIATPATMPFAKKPRLDQSESTKHMSVSSREPPNSERIVAPRRSCQRGRPRSNCAGFIADGGRDWRAPQARGHQRAKPATWSDESDQEGEIRQRLRGIDEHDFLAAHPELAVDATQSMSRSTHPPVHLVLDLDGELAENKVRPHD